MQVRPNDLIQFKRLTLEEAYSKLAYLDAMESAVRSLALGSTTSIRELVGGVEAAAKSASEVPPELQLPSRPILKTVPASKTHPGAEYRLAGMLVFLLMSPAWPWTGPHHSLKLTR